MSNPRRGEATITIDGKSYVVKANLNALCEIEESLGIKTISDLDLERPSMRAVRSIFGALLRGGGNDMSDTDAGALINAADEELMENLARAFEAALGEAEENPPQAASSTGTA